jgi:Transposase and inactivated derivatives
VAAKLRVRRPTPEEGDKLLRIVRRGHKYKATTYRRALVILGSAGGNSVQVLANLVQTSQDRVREVIHAFNEKGLDCLDPKWAGGRPRQISAQDRALILKVADKRPRSLGRPFTRWSIRKLRRYLATKKGRKVTVSTERLRQILYEEDITFKKTKTWKESSDPDYDAKCARIEEVLNNHPNRTFAFDEFGPLAIRPYPGSAWSQKGQPQRLPANYSKKDGTSQFFACYSVGEDTLWGVLHRKKSQRAVLRALKSIRDQRPDGEMIYVILDNLPLHKTDKIRKWCAENNVELCFTPTSTSWANPIECHFGPIREFALNNSYPRSHRALSRALHKHCRWRNENSRDPAILEAERKERARVRSEAGRRWGERQPRAA